MYVYTYVYMYRYEENHIHIYIYICTYRHPSIDSFVYGFVKEFQVAVLANLSYQLTAKASNPAQNTKQDQTQILNPGLGAIRQTC